MKHIIIYIILLTFNPLIDCKLTSQTLVGTAGNSLNANQINFSYSIGECITAVHETEGFIIIEGFYQGLTTKSSETSIQLNENPVRGSIKYTSTLKDAKYKLIGLTGQVLLVGDLNGDPIDVTPLKPSIYLLSIYSNNSLINTSKIVIVK